MDSAVMLPPPTGKQSSQNGHGSAAGSGGSTGEMGRKYQPPDWGGQPLSASSPSVAPFSLEVLKSGVVLGELDISSKDHYIIGRQRGVVDLVMEHPSLSRQHAVLQYNKEGILLLGDLGSTHGTYVNKEQLKPTVFRPLHVGDVIRFADSTRLYVLHGPEELRPAEYESENLRRKREHAEARGKADSATEQRQKEEEKRDEGASWGFDDDAVEDDEEEGDEEDENEENLPEYLKGGIRGKRMKDTKLTMSSEEVSEKDLKQMEKLRAKVQKIENLYTEMERIQAKDNSQGGLTDGQKAQVARNEACITELRSQIADIEQTLKGKQRQREEGKAALEASQGKQKEQEGTEREGAMESDFDFYDRTKRLKGRGPVNLRRKNAKKTTKEEVKVRRFGVMTLKAKRMSSLYGGIEGEEDKPSGSSEREGEVLTHNSLLEKKEKLLGRLENTRKAKAEVESEMKELQRVVDAAAEKKGEGDAQAAEGGQDIFDPLDAFMHNNKFEHLKLTQKAIAEQEEGLLQELAVLGRRIALTKSALPELSSGEKEPKSKPADEASNMAPSQSLQSSTALSTSSKSPSSAPTFEPTEDAPVGTGGMGVVKSAAMPTPAVIAGKRKDMDSADSNCGEIEASGKRMKSLLPSAHGGASSSVAAAMSLFKKSAEKKQQREVEDEARVGVGGVVGPPEEEGGQRHVHFHLGGTVKGPSARPWETKGKEGAGVGGKATGKAQQVQVEQDVALEDGTTDWIPPTGQIGDGRTSLNEKLGY